MDARCKRLRPWLAARVQIKIGSRTDLDARVGPSTRRPCSATSMSVKSIFSQPGQACSSFKDIKFQLCLTFSYLSETTIMVGEFVALMSPHVVLAHSLPT